MDFSTKRIHYRDTETRRVAVLSAAFFVLCGVVFAMQKNQNTTAAEVKPKVVPITEEQHHHLVLDNDYVRVFHVEVAPHSETLYHQHDMDYVFVTLGDSKVASERVDGKQVTLELKDGDTRFTKGGFAHKAVNLSDKPFVNVTVELKKNSEPLQDCEPCSARTTTASNSRGKVTRSSLLFSKDTYVGTWDLSGRFTHPISVRMPDFLLVPLSDFQSYGSTTSTMQKFQAGQAGLNKAGTYYWNPKTKASFVTIEFGRVDE